MPEAAPFPKRIIGLFPELLGVGGIQEAGRMTAAALNGIAILNECSVDLLTLNDPLGKHSLETESPIPLTGFGRAKVRFALSAVGLARASAGNGASVVLAAHPNLAVPARWMKQMAQQVKIVVMSHGIEVWKPLPAYRHRALMRADLVLAPSRFTAKKLAEVQGVPPEKIRRLPWPLNPDFLRLAGAPTMLPLPSSFPQGRVILTVGRWAAAERYKGTDELIHAVAQLREKVLDIHLVAVGGGDDLPRLRALAIELGIADRVQFLENLSREQIAACYAHADIFSLPSTGEGFGLVFLEAMAFSKAVVGISCGGTTDVIEEGINGLLISPGDAEGLAHALERLLCDEALRAELGRRGAEIVRQKYQFGIFQEELERVLGDCAFPQAALV